MKARPYLFEDYPTLLTWWEAHGWTPPPLESLPAMGIIVEGHAAGFIYNDPTCNLIGLEFMVTHPLNTPRQSAQAIKTLAESAQEIGKMLGKAAIFTTCRQPSLARLLESSGYKQTDTAMIHLIQLLT